MKTAVFTPSHTAPAPMPMESDITALILQTVRRTQPCDMEDLLKTCSSFTWNQVFLEVDRLSRTGSLRLLARRGGGYAVTLPAA